MTQNSFTGIEESLESTLNIGDDETKDFKEANDLKERQEIHKQFNTLFCTKKIDEIRLHSQKEQKKIRQKAMREENILRKQSQIQQEKIRNKSEKNQKSIIKKSEKDLKESRQRWKKVEKEEISRSIFCPAIKDNLDKLLTDIRDRCERKALIKKK